MKKLLMVLAVIVMVTALTAGQSPFSDVPKGHWAYKAVARIAEAGILTGYKDGKLQGEGTLTRYEFALLLARTVDAVNKDPDLLARMTPETLSDVDLIAEEFEDELTLLGMRQSKLKTELSAINGQLSKIKEEVGNIKATRAIPNKRLRLSGDSTVKYVSIKYSDDLNESFYNSEYFEQRIAINLSGRINPGVRAFVRLDKYGDWNTRRGDWSTNNTTTGTRGWRSDTDFRTSLALVDVTSLGNLDLLRLGRQPFRVGNLLNVSGTYDGIVATRTVKDDPWYLIRLGGFKYNNLAAANGSTDTNDNDGLDLGFFSVKANYDDRFLYEIYYSRLSNAMGTFMPDGTRNIGNVPEDSLEVQSWIGLSLNYNFTDQLQFFGEISQKRWEESLDIDGNGTVEDDDLGYLAGLKYQYNFRNNYRLQYLRYQEFFTSIGVNGGSIIRRAEAMKYWRDFHSWLFNYDHSFDRRSGMTLRYEDINDDSEMTAANQTPDDRNVLSLIYKYKYKPNSKITLTYRRIDTNDNASDNVTPVASGRHSGFIDNADITTLAADTVGDLYQLNLQLDINF